MAANDLYTLYAVYVAWLRDTPGAEYMAGEGAWAGQRICECGGTETCYGFVGGQGAGW
jgi:hypothetical protein